MPELNDLEKLFHHQLKDTYNAEQQLLDALPKMKEQASSEELRSCIDEHLQETMQQKERLEEVGRNIGLDNLSGEKCEAMEGLIQEASSFISEDADEIVKDAGIIADAQRIEHYEISAYGTLTHYAKSLDHNDAADMLAESLDEESAADEKLNQIAIDNINKRAKEQ